MKKLASLALIAVVGLGIAHQGHCLRPSPNAQTAAEAEKKVNEELTQTIRERELSKAEARRRIREKEAAAARKAETVQVRVHAGGVDPLSRNKTVVMTSEMSKREFDQRKFGDLNRRAKESRLAHARSQSSPMGTTGSLDSGSRGGESRNALATFLVLAVMGMGALYFARRDSFA